MRDSGGFGGGLRGRGRGKGWSSFGGVSRAGCDGRELTINHVLYKETLSYFI